MSECRCTLAIRLTGDGCRHCQPQTYIDNLETWIDEERARIAELEAALRVEKADAERWREFSKGKALTVKMKKSTVVFGPNPEPDYAESLSTAIDKLLKD
jgi:ABC-type Na+ transport system ATPase subunit NatA